MNDNNDRTLQEGSNKPVEQATSDERGNTPASPQDASQGQAKSNEKPAFNLDALLDEHLTGKEFEKTKHTGVDYNKVLADLPSDAKKLIQNLREDYRQKTTAISKKKKALEKREEHLLSSKTEEHLRTAMELPEDLDLYDPEGLKRFIEAKAAQQLDSLLKPARADLAKTTRVEEIRMFEKEHPDIKQFQVEIRDLIKAKGMKIEDAYFMIKGRMTKGLLEEKNEELKAYKAAARENGYKISVGRPTASSKPKFKTAYEVYKHLKATGKT